MTPVYLMENSRNWGKSLEQIIKLIYNPNSGIRHFELLKGI